MYINYKRHSVVSNLIFLFFICSSSLDAVAPKPEPINWDFYAKNVSKPGMVEAFRKAVSYM